MFSIPNVFASTILLFLYIIILPINNFISLDVVLFPSILIFIYSLLKEGLYLIFLFKEDISIIFVFPSLLTSKVIFIFSFNILLIKLSGIFTRTKVLLSFKNIFISSFTSSLVKLTFKLALIILVLLLFFNTTTKYVLFEMKEVSCSISLEILKFIKLSSLGISSSFLFCLKICNVAPKKTKIIAGDPAPFVMELPAYHLPTVGNVLRSMWERGWSFIKKAGTVILLSAIVLWFLQSFGWENGFGMVEDLDNSVLAKIGKGFAWIFAPLGWGEWKAAVATVTGLIAKENVVTTFGQLFHFAGEELSENGDEIWSEVSTYFTALSAYSFLVFNLLCAPCFAAMGAIKREMNSAKWTLFAIGYQCVFAYAVSLIIYQVGSIFTVNVNVFCLIVALILIAFIIYMLVRPYKESNKLTAKVRIKS